MDSFADKRFLCYCEAQVLGSELVYHFDSCPKRGLSSMHNYFASECDSYKGTSYGYFYAMEAYWEGTQLFAQPQLPIIGHCEMCPGSDINGSRYYDDCEHVYCKKHKPEGPCPRCRHCNMCSQLSSPYITLGCTHTFCNTHIKEAFPRKLFEMPCFVCNTPMLRTELKEVMGEQEVDDAEMRAAGFNIVRCPKCRYGGVLEPGAINPNIKDAKGRQYSRAAAENYCKYRFSCPEANCRTSMCSDCLVSPYHDALTCDQYKKSKNGTCRYCEEFPPVGEDCCEQPECMKVLQRSCRKVLPCGHRCYGTAGEFSCPPCLVDNCIPHQKSSENEYCCICGSEKLRNGPVVELECGHYLHYQCLKDALFKRWSGTRITFKFCTCPLDQEWAVPRTNEELQQEVAKYQQLRESIKARALDLLGKEPEERKRIDDPKDQHYFGRPERYVMDRFCFYECARCRNVYFGGKKECEDNSDQMQNPNELLCPNCIARAPGTNSKNCLRHGIDFIEYKCRFCCSVASYFCWGTTHFCEACHKRHNDGEHLNKKTPADLPQCQGAYQCPLGVPHLPNGEEFVLGCSLCRKGEV